MKTMILFIVLASASLVAMLVVDALIGEKAEFLNAWSVVERLLGRPASAGDSVVFQKVGAVGELVCVLAVNALIGGLLTLLAKRWL